LAGKLRIAFQSCNLENIFNFRMPAKGKNNAEGALCELAFAPFDLSTVLAAGILLGGIGFTQEATKILMSKGNRLLGGFDVLWLKGAVAQSKSWLTAQRLGFGVCQNPIEF